MAWPSCGASLPPLPAAEDAGDSLREQLQHRRPEPSAIDRRDFTNLLLMGIHSNSWNEFT
jgi:hypothetical protein